MTDDQIDQPTSSIPKEVMDRIEYVKEGGKRIIYPVNFLTIEGDQPVHPEMMKIHQNALSKENRIGFCPHAVPILKAAEEVFGIDPSELVNSQAAGYREARYWCGVSCRSCSAGGTIKMGFEGESYIVDCICDRLVASLLTVRFALIRSLDRVKWPDFIDCDDEGNFCIPLRYLEEAGTNPDRLSKMAQQLERYRSAKDVLEFIRTRSGEQVVMEFIESHIDAIRAFAPVGMFATYYMLRQAYPEEEAKKTELACSQVPREWDSGIYYG